MRLLHPLVFKTSAISHSANHPSIISHVSDILSPDDIEDNEIYHRDRIFIPHEPSLPPAPVRPAGNPSATVPAVTPVHSAAAR